jgi:hypothetical protein
MPFYDLSHDITFVRNPISPNVCPQIIPLVQTNRNIPGIIW